MDGGRQLLPHFTMDYIFSLKERKRIARQIAIGVWGAVPSTKRLGKARKIVEGLLNAGETNRVTIYHNSIQLLKTD